MYAMRFCMYISMCVCENLCVCERERMVGDFCIEQKLTVHKEALPLSHFNVNEPDSVRGLKNSLGAWRRPSLGHTCTCVHTHNRAATAPCMHTHTLWRREAQIKSSESLSECQLPLGQRLLCVCAGRRTAFYVSFSNMHTLFFSHTHPPGAAPLGWHAVSVETHKRQRNLPEKTDISNISYITHEGEKKRVNKIISKWF